MNDSTESDVSITEITSNTLPKKLGKEDILGALPKLGLVPILSPNALASDANDLLPLYYTCEQAVIFPPVTDNPNNSKNGLRGVSEIVSRAIEAKNDLMQDKKFLLFPLFEEWNPWMRGAPRQQWVLLIYVNSENKFYLLDPTSSTRSSFYESNLKYIKEALTTSFKSILGDIQFVPSYLNLQSWTDSDSGGHWILYCITRLITGSTITDLQNLSKQKPVIQLGKVKNEIEEKFKETLESSTPPLRQYDRTPEQSEHDIEEITNNFTPRHSKQNYAVEGEPASLGLMHNLVSVRPREGFNLERTSSARRPAPQSSFLLKLYSFLMFAGTATALVALFCLSTTPPLLTATVSTGVLATGVVMFLGGVLGKCGLFGGAQPPANDVTVSQTDIHSIHSV